MSSYGNTLFQTALEPFEEAVRQGPATDRLSNLNQHRSSNALDKPMDETAVVSRRLSRRDSKNTSGRSIWRRKSTKKRTESPTATATQVKHLSSLASTHSSPSMDPNDDNDGARSSQENATSSLISRSIIPDPLGELPAWFKKESDMAAANISTFRIKYPLHNPNGPRWYTNHHLLPPASLNRPPSLFSPSFPHMAASMHSIQDPSQDSTRPPGPSRSPSGTPLPTPSSSQVRIPDPSVKPRSRKTSQDNVDLMDVSDPWGTRWHHESPYDAGSSISPVSVDSPEGAPRTRSRLSSTNTGQARRKTVTPSPLSQSTSAIHLQAPEPTHVTRKLSKRHKPVFAGLFGTHEKDAPEGQETDPVEDSSSSLPKRLSAIPSGALHINFGGSKRLSTFSPMSISANGSTAALSSHSSSKHDKRQSILGRLARKFSILRRSGQDPVATINEWSEGASGVAALSAVEERSSRRSLISQRQPSPEKPVTEKKVPDPSKRIPPPRIDLDMEPQSGNGPSIEVERADSDRTSSISYDVPFSPLGKLMIANPDAPSSGGTTPVRMNNALPPEAPGEPPLEPKYPTQVVPTAQRIHSANRHQDAKPTSVPSSAGRSSPIPGLLSPISVAVPAITFPEVSQFMATTRSPNLPVSIPPSSPSPGLRLSTSAPVQVSIPAPLIGDLSSRSSPSPINEALRPIPPHLVFPVVDDSPLSKASVLVNPPTPYNTDDPHSELPAFERVPTDRSDDNRRSFPKQVSPTKEADDQQVDDEVRLTKSNSTTSRKTETYKLVRTHSDKVSSASQAAFQAEGDQWLVVNSVEVPRRRRTKERAEKTERIEKPSSRTSREREREKDRGKERERDRERGEREKERERDRGRERGRDEERERRRKQEKTTRYGDEDQRRTASHAKVKSPVVDKTDSGSLSGRPGRTRSLDTTQRPTLVQPLIFTLQDEPPRHRKSDDRPRDSIHQGHSKTARPGPSPIVTVARVDRLPPMSARPTSELTSAADMNALKAREAWEMDRLWKGRSMVQGQPETSVVASPSSIESKAANETARDAFSIQSFAHGSSHTSYVVQPLQAHPIPASVFYANMPSAPPPIIYAATSPYGQPHPSASRDYTTYHSLPNSFSFPSKDSLVDQPTRPNPLPAPPRESSYQPVHLPVLADRSSGSASEYWGKYANMSHS